MKTIARCVCVLALIVCVACGDKAKNRFSDEVYVKIAEFQDLRQSDSLLEYLKSNNEDYVRAASLALGSIQDTSAIEYLTSQYPEAAFALGQMYDKRAVMELQNHRNSVFSFVEAKEALGKVISKEQLDLLSPIGDDSLSQSGLAWGIYRAGLRGVTDSASVLKAKAILSEKQLGHTARLGAAHFFSRTNYKFTQPGVETALVDAAFDGDAEIRMAVINSLTKINPEVALPGITKGVDDSDYRVRVSAARALRTQPWDVAKPLFEKLLSDENVHVNIAAAEVILNLAKKDTAVIHEWARIASNWRTQATLYESAPLSGNEVKSLYAKSSNTYQQAALLTALSQGDNAAFVFNQFKANDAKVIKSTASAAIVRINRRKATESSKFVEMYKHIIADGDQGAIIPVCSALTDSTLGFKKIITDYSFLEEAKLKLSLPRDYETYAPLQQALNYFRNLPPPPPLANEFNHPIDWKLAATIDKDQRVTIETTKGTIVMQLFIEEAPGSVVNFVKLLNDKYFDGKYFHRVVPNFVIQTGCNRGDGFGGEDYSIRSEFSQRKYKTGSVGMASAGKDTEGTQWFITHSPTPHLDGKYTIFAEVISGMDVVHKIEVGDQIVSAQLVNGK